MGKGGYLGGSTIVGAGWDGFSYSKSKRKQQKPRIVGPIRQSPQKFDETATDKRPLTEYDRIQRMAKIGEQSPDGSALIRKAVVDAAADIRTAKKEADLKAKKAKRGKNLPKGVAKARAKRRLKDVSDGI